MPGETALPSSVMGERWRGRAGGSRVPADARAQSGVPGTGPG